MGFFKTLFTGYRIMYQDLNTKHNDLIPRCFSGCGTGLMMIGSAVMARTAMKEDVQQVIAEADAAIEEARKSKKRKDILKAKASKGLKMVRVFRNGVAMEVGGAVLNGVGYKMAENGKHTALKALGSLGATFAAYRANVREDLGDEADTRYMSGRKAVKRTQKIDKKTGEITEELSYADEDGVYIRKDPNSFRILYSPETCPGICSENYNLRLNQAKTLEDNMTLKYQTVGHISLNDMRREFGGLQPEKMDVEEGGIFGKVLDPNIPRHMQRINLHFRDDQDFMEGRKNWCYMIFDCEVMIGKMNRKPTAVEG